MSAFKLIGSVVLATVFTLALAIDAADARRGGGGGRGFSGGGMRAGGFSGGRAGFAGGGRAHVSRPIARPPIANRPGFGGPGYGNRPGYGPGWGYRPGYGWGAAAVGAGLAASAASGYYGSGYYDDGYTGYDAGAYGASDPIAECARRFKTYDPASQTYIVRKGVRASCP
jgi:hypothetical protein